MKSLVKRLVVISIIILSMFSIGCSSLNTSRSEQLKLLNSAFSDYKIDEAIEIVNNNKENENFMDECLLIINNYINKYKLKYEIDEISQDTYIKINQLAYEIIGDNLYKEIIINIENNKKQTETYIEAVKLIEEKDYITAIKKLKTIDSDNENYNKAVELINEYGLSIKEEMVNEINEYVSNKNFTLAIEKLNELSDLFPDDQGVLTFKSEVTKYHEEYKKSIQVNNEIAANKRKSEEEYNKAYEKVLDICKEKYKTNDIEVSYEGIFVLQGNEYYSFFTTINDIPSGDCKKLVKKSDYSIYDYYSNGDLFPIYDDGTTGNKVTSIDNPIEVSISELCKNQYKYMGQYVRITGTINYIDESFVPNNMILVNNQREYVHMSYFDNSSYYKGDVITVTGLLISTTSDFAVNGIQVTMPSIDMGKIN